MSPDIAQAMMVLQFTPENLLALCPQTQEGIQKAKGLMPARQPSCVDGREGSISRGAARQKMSSKFLIDKPIRNASLLVDFSIQTVKRAKLLDGYTCKAHRFFSEHERFG